MNFGNVGFGEVNVLLFILIIIVPAWRLCAKTGNSGALALLMFIPIVNVIVFLYLAFSEWPIERELRKLKGE